MRPAASFALSILIRRVLAESSSVEPDDLAREVFELIPDTDRDDALRQALRSVVRETHRPHFIPRPDEGDAKWAASATVPQQRGSTKVAAIRSAWQRSLAQRIAVEDGHKFLRDCTAVDLEYAADQREQHAKRVLARARDLRTLAEVMREHGAAKLSDVPAEVLGNMHDTLAQVAA